MKIKDIRIIISHCIVLLCLGLVYAWSVFKKPLGNAFSWNDSQLTWTFTICMSFFCIGGFLGAKLTKRIRHQWVVIGGGVLLLLGFVLASRTRVLWHLYVSYGVFVGLSVGIIYNCILSAGNARFHKIAGTISGLFLMCFGIGGFIFAPLCNFLLKEVGWSKTFLYLGITIFFIIILGSFQVVVPERPKESSPAQVKARNEDGSFTTKEMVSRRSFWLYSLWTTLLSSVNMAIVGQVFTISSYIHLSDATSAFMVSLVSVCCGIGRICFGSLYDRKGRGLTMRLIAGLMLGGSILLTVCLKGNLASVLAAGLILMGIGYGGITPTNSNYVRGFYGIAHYPVNFSLVNFNLLPSVFIGQFIGSTLYLMTGSYGAGTLVMAVMCAAGLGIEFLIKKP